MKKSAPSSASGRERRGVMRELKKMSSKRNLETDKRWWAASLTRILVGAALAVLVAGAPHIKSVHAQTTRFVAITGNDQGGTNNCSNSGQPCATIQNAVNHSAIGDLVQIGPGTYFENVAIFSSSGPPDQLTFQGDLTTGSVVNGNGTGPVFAVGGSHAATFKNLTITNGNSGPGTGSAGGAITSGGATKINVIGCTLSGNAATGNPSAGGAILNANGGILTVINSTISGNSSGQAGGIQNQGTATLINTTIAGNTASPSVPGGIFSSGGSVLNLTNSLIAGNSGGDCLNDGSLATNDHNLIQDGSCSPALSGDPKLGPLASNGGPTFTQALLAGSPAIDAGDDSVLGNPFNLTTDQRGVGFPRKVGAHVDIGAYESVAPPMITCPSNITVMLSPGQTTASVTLAATAIDPRDGPLTPVYKIGSTVITSPNTFGVGTTTVSVSATDSLNLTATCSFTVTVVCAAPTIACPGNITAFSDPGRATATVSFGASASDACDGTVTPVYTIGNRVITSPFMFPPGVTTVTATAAGSNGLMASCTFTVAVALLNECIQDDHSGDTFRFNSTTGQYVYTRCKDKFTLTGTGIVSTSTGMANLTDSRSDRRISGGFNPGTLTGRANITLILAPGVYQTITVNQTNPSATCACR